MREAGNIKAYELTMQAPAKNLNPENTRKARLSERGLVKWFLVFAAVAYLGIFLFMPILVVLVNAFSKGIGFISGLFGSPRPWPPSG